MWWSKKEVEVEKPTNIYTTIDRELERLHAQFDQAINEHNNVNNADIFLHIIREYRDSLILALKEQPSNHDAIRDLQDTVTEMLLTETESK